MTVIERSHSNGFNTFVSQKHTQPSFLQQIEHQVNNANSFLCAFVIRNVQKELPVVLRQKGVSETTISSVLEKKFCVFKKFQNENSLVVVNTKNPVFLGFYFESMVSDSSDLRILYNHEICTMFDPEICDVLRNNAISVTYIAWDQEKKTLGATVGSVGRFFIDLAKIDGSPKFFDQDGNFLITLFIQELYSVYEQETDTHLSLQCMPYSIKSDYFVAES